MKKSFQLSKLPLFFLCLVMVLLVLPISFWFSYVDSEENRLASGLIYLERADYSSFHVNPPLSNVVGAFPSFVAGDYCPTRTDLGYHLFGRMESKAGSVWMKKNEHHHQSITAGRCCMIIFPLLGTIAIYLSTKQLFNNITTAIIASIIWITCPYILGHGVLICPDVPSAAVGLLAVYFFWRWLKKPEMLAAFIAGIILGLAELSKFTLLIFYPLFVLIWLIYRLPELRTLSRRDFVAQIGQLVLLFAMSILIINMGYLFEDTGRKLGKFKFQTTLFTGCENLKDVPPIGGNR
ncbi:MAG: glycosyltransferase family 39 protein, partial [Planctomycetaceae bacterium]|nr:glycosyltransferase family 39 protein [Planctomycetaceae bacterium]